MDTDHECGHSRRSFLGYLGMAIVTPIVIVPGPVVIPAGSMITVNAALYVPEWAAASTIPVAANVDRYLYRIPLTLYRGGK